jgi:acetolactate synthase I/II/III large subunit
MNGAESLVKTLLASGVTTCFANPGTSEMHFVAALDQHPDMRCILCLFEGGASGAADGYFRMSGQVAATLLHLAPGFGNAFANLHNAAKAGSGVLTIMGDHATWHQGHETPLRGDTVGISTTISHWTRMVDLAGSVAPDGAEAITAARSGNGRIATLILPADTAWDQAIGPAIAAPPPALRRPDDAQILAAAKALGLPGAVFLIDGTVLWGEAKVLAARIAKATGCQLFCPCFAARIGRGQGALKVRRLAFRIADMIRQMADVPAMVVCGTTRPAGFFAYPGLPSVPEPVGCAVLDLCGPDMDVGWTLQALADALGCADLDLGPQDFQGLALPAIPTGPITLPKLGQAIAALMPQDAIVVDEMISSGPAVAPEMLSARAHDWLNISGGSIGYGLPCAVGAAVACPDRKVLALQADGSGMYTLQSLWTMAREALDVTVVIFANRGYQILRLEMAAVGVTDPGRNARAMFDIAGPELDWVALAKGHGVDAVRVTDMDQFAAAFAGAMSRKGPYLIEVPC